MDYTGINSQIEKIQSDIKDLLKLIDKSFVGKFSDGEAIITEAILKNIDNAYESLEQTKALCDLLTDAYEDDRSDSENEFIYPKAHDKSFAVPNCLLFDIKEMCDRLGKK